MIYTVTLNPSVDFVTRLDALVPGTVNASREECLSVDGRALTISRILHTLDVPTTATGFIGGQTGSYVEEILEEEGILNDFIRVKNNTRLNMTLWINGVETRISGHSSDISEPEVNDLLYYLSRIREGDYLVVAGSLPQNLNESIYERMFDIATVNGAAFLPIVETSAMQNQLRRKPLLITPNCGDLAELFDKDVVTQQEAIGYAKELRKRGAQNVLVDLEEDGSFFVTQGAVFQADGPQLPVVSSDYANMAHIAGFIGNYMRTNEAKKAFPAAQGCANATFAAETLPSRDSIVKHSAAVKIHRIE